MKRDQYPLFILFFICFSWIACKKDLTVYPDKAYADGNLIKDEQTAKAVLTGVYYRFANGGTDALGKPLMRWTDINEYIPSVLAGSLSYAFGSYDSVGTFTFSPAFGVIDSIWVYSYSLVNAANGFIRNATPVSSIPSSSKHQMLAEARFLRAFGNSELLFYFGQYRDLTSKYGIILRDTFVTARNVNLPRSSVAAAYASILADLDVAIDGLPVQNAAIYYANASAAKLLKARVLINRGAPGDYAQVIALTNDIITNGPFALEDSLKNIFLTKGFNSNEVMLGLQPYPAQRWKINALEWGESASFAALLAGDSRNRWMYYINTQWFAYSFNEVTKYYAGNNPANPKPSTLNENCYAFRLTEAYLLEAEAIVLSGGNLDIAKTLLKTVLLHAGAGGQERTAVDSAMTPEMLQLEIVKENLRNFIFENGVDWLALRRLPFATIQLLNPNIKDVNKLILPIPATELIFNNVIQNPGY